MEPQQNEVESVIAPLKKVTSLSKYLALSLFIILPFLGGWIGYNLAPEKVLEVERILIKEVSTENSETKLSTTSTLFTQFTYQDTEINLAFELNNKFQVEKNDLHTQFLIRQRDSENYFANLNIEPLVGKDGISRCYLMLCEKKSLESFPALIGEWQYLGETSGYETSTGQHTYRLESGDYHAYLRSDQQLHSEGAELNSLISTFRLEVTK